jgi:phosphohistidine swiveling domain-containing protein
MSIGKAIELSVLWQDNRKENILRYLHYKNMLLDEVIRRKGWRKDDLLNFSFEEIAEMFSGTDYAAAIEERKKGFAEYITNTRTLLNSDESRRYLALYSNQEAAGDEREISGIVASKGIAMGRVRILLDPHQSDRLSPGEVLVAPMTSPEYIFAMRRAVAIVTDSGGLTSHAAIVSRELEVPCIVGTKIATQVLHDGDLVEVDADNGVVRVIERVSDALYNKDTHWTHYLTRPFTLFGASLWQEWYNSPETHKVMGSQMKNALFIEQVPGVARNYRKYDELEDHKRCVKTLCEQNAQKVKAFLEEGVLLNREAKKYLSGEMKFVDIASAMDFLICLSLRATILPYWVIAFSEEITYQDTQLLTLAENIRSVSLYPNLVSQVIIPLAEEELRARGFDPSVLPYMTLQELLSGADDVASQRMSLSHRRKFFVYQILNGAENVSFVSDPAAVIATLEHVDDHDGVRGQAAFQGNVKGIARIVYSIVEKKEFNMGDILVSINSNPSLLPLIQKCGAIITDEGGIMCHAAIVARELKKPCIIGTKIATQVLHDGDLVEVDADQGVVRVIEKAEGTQAVSAKG